MALIALIVALSGTGYAATKITSKDVKNNSLTGAEPRWAELTDRLRILGVDEYGTSGIDIKLFLNARPGEQWRVGREFRRRLLPALDRAGVRIPYEHHEVILRPARSGAKDGPPR